MSGDIVGVEILERQDGRAVDEFLVELDGPELVELLRAECIEVDGVEVEHILPAATRR